MNAPRPLKVPESVLVVVHTAALDVLLLERADIAGFWQSVTGSKDRADEPLVETCVREVDEETGIRVGSADAPRAALVDWRRANAYDIDPRFLHRYPPGVTRNTEHVFSLCVAPGLAVRVVPREHLRFAWLDWRSAAARCTSATNAAAIRELPLRAQAATPDPAP